MVQSLISDGVLLFIVYLIVRAILYFKKSGRYKDKMAFDAVGGFDQPHVIAKQEVAAKKYGRKGWGFLSLAMLAIIAGIIFLFYLAFVSHQGVYIRIPW